MEPGNTEYPNDVEIEREAELDPFAQNAKSSVEIKETTRGPTIKVKVVTGEEKLIDGLTTAALRSFRKIQGELKKEETKPDYTG